MRRAPPYEPSPSGSERHAGDGCFALFAPSRILYRGVYTRVGYGDNNHSICLWRAMLCLARYNQNGREGETVYANYRETRSDGRGSVHQGVTYTSGHGGWNGR